MKQRSAFTLIELSLVVLVISAIIFGVMKGGSMIEAARLDSARSYTSASVVPKIPGLLAWYETSLKESLKPAETPDGSQISTWYDISPGSIVAQQNSLTRTASSAVTLERSGINKLPSINFIGTGILTLSTFYQGNISPYNSFFIVCRPVKGELSTGRILVDSYGGTRTTAMLYNKIGLWDEGGSAYVYTGTSTNPIAVSGGLDYIISANYNGTSSKVFQNSVGTLAGNGNLSLSNNATQGLTVGGNTTYTTGSRVFIGLISEVIVYNRPLQLNERREVVKYLSKKYNITTDDT